MSAAVAAQLYPWEMAGWQSRSTAGIVTKDAEFDRIAALPRRTAPVVDIPLLESFLRAPGGTMHLREKQAWLLSELYLMRGAVGPLPTGYGKTLISMLAAQLPHPQDRTRPWVERPLLVVDGALQEKAEDVDIPKLRPHWRIHPNQRVITYQLLQSPTQVKLLWKMMPDLIVFDESQACRNTKAARTMRIDQFINDYPHTMVVVLSASFFKRKLEDAAHLFWWALHERSPLPRPGSRALEDFGRALNQLGVDTENFDPGALWQFCNKGETPKEGYRRRITESPGVVADFSSSCDSALNIFGVAPALVPPEVVQAFARMRQTNQTPSGDELTDRFNIWRRVRELAFGFYYRWAWPNNQPDIEWISARAEWRRFVRYVLRHNGRGIDTERRVRDAVDAGLYGKPGHGPDSGNGAHGAAKLAEWRRVSQRWPEGPPRETIWISDYVARTCAEWLLEKPKKGKAKGRLCWTEHDALGKMIASIANVPFFAGGDGGAETYQGGPCVVSIHSNSRGRNLQDRYSENLYAAVPDGGDVWEQSISRTHRDGQPEDEVTAWIFLHCVELWESFEHARRDAQHIQQIGGQQQKLNIATLALLTEQQVSGRLEASSDPLWSRSRRED